MSAIASEVSTTSDLSHVFNPPIAPAPDTDLDSEMLSYYFDASWTTKDIAVHFSLTVPVVVAWFQRPDIAALINFITAANEPRARDIALEDLPGTIDILHRISRLRSDDKLSRAASSALIHFSRTRSPAKPGDKQSSPPSTRSRRAEPSIPRRTRDDDAATHHARGTVDPSESVESLPAAGRNASLPPSAQGPATIQPARFRSTPNEERPPTPRANDASTSVVSASPLCCTGSTTTMRRPASV